MRMNLQTANQHSWRTIKNVLASAATFFSAVIVVAPLALVFFHLLANGLSSVNWDFFTHLPKQAKQTK